MEDARKRESGLDRRAFLGMAAVGAAGLGVAGLAGCAKKAEAESGPDANSASGLVSAPDSWDMEADFVVLGAGTSLTGALKAAKLGMSVIVVEKWYKVGGTTANSGGSVWIPCNSYAKDDAALAKKYMMKVADGLSTEAIVDQYIKYGGEMMDFITEAAGVKWALADRTDYHVSYEGGTRKVRTLKPLAADGKTQLSGAGYTDPEAAALKKLGGQILLNTSAKWLVTRPTTDGTPEVLGVVAQIQDGSGELDKYYAAPETTATVESTATSVGSKPKQGTHGKTLYIKAKKGVLIGTGGFDYNEALKLQFLDLPSPFSAAIPTSDGDGLLMAQAVGADLALMAYGWGNVCYLEPASKDYAKRNTASFGANAPMCYQNDSSAMWINRYGRRFCDESANYDSFYYGFGNGRDTTGDMTYTNIPAWYVCDHKNRLKAAKWGVKSDAALPSWVYTADTLEKLADLIGVDKENFLVQVAKFNKYAAEGKDPEFHRGEDFFDQGGPGRPADCLEPMDTPPFYAAKIAPFWQGTKGGPRTDEWGRVMHVTGKPVPRLYACGNAAGCGTPGKYYNGAGGTVAPGMVYSYVAAIDAQKLQGWS